jgi:hypothetical protein
VLWFSASLLAPPSAHAQCESFSDGTQVVDTDSCGDVDYELGVYDYDGNYEDYEPATSYGGCYAAYYDCNNNYNSASDFGQAQCYGPNPDGAAGDYGEYFYWQLDNYYVSGYSSCNNGNNNDTVLDWSNVLQTTGDFEAINDCY